MAKKEPIGWITVNGVHVPLYEGESKADAVRRSIVEKEEKQKDSQIKKAKDTADKLNAEKKTESKKVKIYGNKDKGDTKISNIYSWLKKAKEDEIVIRSSYIMSSWDDIKTDAMIAGFEAWRNPSDSRFTGFNESYTFKRKKK